MGKYDPLRKYLAERAGDGDEFTMSFAQIEKLVGKLPSSARVRGWWENENRGTAGAGPRAWLSAGWRVQSLEQGGQGIERVVFSRIKTSTDARHASISPHTKTHPVSTSSAESAGLSNSASIAEHGPARVRVSRRALFSDVAIALVVAAGAGISGIIGLSHLPWWALTLLSAAVGAAGFTVGQAITSCKATDIARWWSITTVVTLLMCTGAFIYHKFFDPLTHQPQTYQFVVNGDESKFIPLYGEAGGPEQRLATGYAGQKGLIGGQTYNFDCWTIGRDSAKWFRYERFGQTWWAPSALLHAPTGESQPRIPPC